jgi:hypothetical protein
LPATLDRLAPDLIVNPAALEPELDALAQEMS